MTTIVELADTARTASRSDVAFSCEIESETVKYILYMLQLFSSRGSVMFLFVSNVDFTFTDKITNMCSPFFRAGYPSHRHLHWHGRSIVSYSGQPLSRTSQ